MPSCASRDDAACAPGADAPIAVAPPVFLDRCFSVTARPVQGHVAVVWDDAVAAHLRDMAPVHIVCRYLQWCAHTGDGAGRAQTPPPVPSAQSPFPVGTARRVVVPASTGSGSADDAAAQQLVASVKASLASGVQLAVMRSVVEKAAMEAMHALEADPHAFLAEGVTSYLTLVAGDARWQCHTPLLLSGAAVEATPGSPTLSNLSSSWEEVVFNDAGADSDGSDRSGGVADPSLALALSRALRQEAAGESASGPNLQPSQLLGVARSRLQEWLDVVGRYRSLPVDDEPAAEAFWAAVLRVFFASAPAVDVLYSSPCPCPGPAAVVSVASRLPRAASGSHARMLSVQARVLISGVRVRWCRLLQRGLLTIRRRGLTTRRSRMW